MYVGFVLIINSLWMFGKINVKAVIPMNIFVAAIQIAAVIRIMWFMPDATMADFSLAAAILLFSFTYLYVAATHTFNLDTRGLGETIARDVELDCPTAGEIDVIQPGHPWERPHDDTSRRLIQRRIGSDNRFPHATFHGDFHSIDVHLPFIPHTWPGVKLNVDGAHIWIPGYISDFGMAHPTRRWSFQCERWCWGRYGGRRS